MITTLALPNVKAIRTRAEDHTQQYEYVTARAVGYIDKLLPQLYHLIQPQGLLILYKQYTKEEEQDIKTICKKYHMKLQKKHTYTLYEHDITRVLYIIQKQ